MVFRHIAHQPCSFTQNLSTLGRLGAVILGAPRLVVQIKEAQNWWNTRYGFAGRLQTLDPGPEDPGPEDPRTQGPEDSESRGLCCTASVKIQLHWQSLPMLYKPAVLYIIAMHTKGVMYTYNGQCSFKLSSDFFDSQYSII